MPAKRAGSRSLLLIVGILAGLALAELLLCAAGLGYTTYRDLQNRRAIMNRGTCVILCLGESTTALGGEHSYPAQLERILSERRPDLRFTVINGGRVGVRTPEIVDRLPEDLKRYQPDIVVTMMGINDDAEYLPYPHGDDAAVVTALKSSRLFRLLRLGFAGSESDPFRESVLSGPESHMHTSKDYVDRAWAMKPLGAVDEMERLFQRAFELDPGNAEAVLGLGWCAKTRVNLQRARELFLKALRLDPQHVQVLCELGALDLYSGRFDTAEDYFYQAYQEDPLYEWSLVELSALRWSAGHKEEAVSLLQQAVAAHPDGEWAHGRLAAIYMQLGDQDKAAGHFAEVDRIRLNYYNPLTRRSYTALVDILKSFGVQLICMEYPVRSIKPLRRMLADHEGIIFVSHEDTFRHALRNAPPATYFTDLFGGEFGHCTPAGNRLIAETVADTILRELF